MKKPLLLLTILLILFAGCNDDNDDKAQYGTNLKQGWVLTSEKVNGIKTDLSSVPLPELMYLTEQSLCYLAIPENINEEWVYNDHRTAWSYDGSNKTLNIAVLLPITYYVNTITANQLSIYFHLYNTSGSLDLYEKTFSPVQIEVKDLKIRLVN